MNTARSMVHPGDASLLHGLERWATPVVILEPVADETGGDGDFAVVSANESARDTFGTRLVGCRVDRDRPLGPATSLTAELSTALRDDEVSVANRTFINRSSDVMHQRYTMLPSAPWVTVFIEDVTSEVNLRRELAATGQTLARVERWANLGVWELDLVSGSLYWSTQVFEILGLDESGIGTFMDIVHHEDRAMLEHVGERARAQAGPYRVTHRILRDGEVRTLDQHMQSVLGSDGRPSRLLGTMIDVTATEALHHDLHGAVQMRTLGLLAGGVAHDLKNAMAVVAGHADLLLTTLSADSQLKPSVEAISRAGHRAANLTRNLMNLGRTAELCPELVEVRELFDDVIELVAPSVDSLVEVDPSTSTDDTLMVIVDRSRTAQVIVDLLFNAGDAGAGRITLSCRAVDLPASDRRCREQLVAPGRYGVIQVRDDGSGMDAATISHAFEPFFSTKDSHHGSGLGLANAHDFARRSGGLVEIESAIGEGTTMSVLLPVHDPDASRQGRSSDARPIRILVGADDESRAQHLAALLETRDRDQLVKAIGSSRVAIVLKTEPIDLVVLDDGTLDAHQLLCLPSAVDGFIVGSERSPSGAVWGTLDVVTEHELRDAVLSRIRRPDGNG